MVFSSLRFFAFLVVILGLTALPLSQRSKKLILCVGSCLFYAAWDWRYLGLLLLIATIDYLCAQRIDASTSHRSRIAWLTFSIVSNLAILGYFKYADFFLSGINNLLRFSGRELSLLNVLLPAGISFYTFKSMSYTIDVYRGVLAPARSRLDYTMFVAFFPDLIAGPIVRASLFLPQLQRRIGPTLERLQQGGSLFLVGLGKKLLVADQMAVIAETIFASPATWSTATAWCGLIAYALQIYCDFSGYSDMAIGTAKMFGYDLPENFDMPYLAASVSEFWRRWHITLSMWLRDYLYIPLGGNRHGVTRTYLSVIITMLLGGLWHGASWTFVVWGLLHGAALVVHRAWRTALPSVKLPRFVAWPVTLLFVTLCWVPFRAVTFADARAMMLALVGLGEGRDVWWPVSLAFGLALVIAGHIAGVAMKRRPQVFAAIDGEVIRDTISGPFLVFRMRTVLGAFVVAAAAMAIYFFGAVESSPFIYFQF